ncbi:MAG: anthranilate synthase component I [Euryarchaeota archaeon]|nr:anthranilate synthase component I [Euryarchaeota archaeon]
MEAEEVRGIAREGTPCIIPLVKALKKADLEPTDVYARLRGKGYSFLLESAEIGEKIARYSFLGRGDEVLSLKDGVARLNGTEHKAERPMEFLRTFLTRYKIHKTEGLPKFFGGLLGYFSYDLVRYFEEIGNGTRDDLGHQDAELLFVRDLIVFDHWRGEILIIANLRLEDSKDAEAELRRGRERIEELEAVVRGATPVTPVKRERRIEVRSNFARAEFEEAVRKAKEYIYAGDVFQVVLAQRFECPLEGDPFNVYLVLKEINPSPYMYFLEFGDLRIIGSSPEILVKVEGRKVVVRPIAGTRPRGRDVVEDEALAREMVNDPKERAEHVMLVDLGRNDLGKVSKFGSVQVDEFMGVEKYSHVQHIVSNVVGTLGDGRDSFDTLEATFPAGTVSGAPKVRAMEIIEELEPSRRGIYAGTVGYFSFDLDMDLAITIRTIVLQGKRAYVQAGAGIVADSVPEMEYQETVNKGKGMLRAMELAGG